MKKTLLILIVILIIPVASMAMKQGEHANMDHSKMNHGSMDQGDGMSMGGDMIMLQSETIDGVTGSAHMMDVKEKMAEHGMSMTHHIMIGFKDQHGMALAKGKVAVKIESPDGKVSKPIMMMGMAGAFGADITLDQEGMYHFKIGSRLGDGKTRTYHMYHDNK